MPVVDVKCREKIGAHLAAIDSLSGHGLGDEVLLLPASFLVLGVHVLVLPHRVQNLTAANTAQLTQASIKTDYSAKAASHTQRCNKVPYE